MAKLHFKYGVMNCGKSDTLIKTAYNYREQGLTAVVIKPSVDTKSPNVVARAGGSVGVDIMVEPQTDIPAALDALQLPGIDCVLCDESQFLTPKQAEQLFEIAKKRNISVIAYGLKVDFATHLFPGSKRLLELADNIS